MAVTNALTASFRLDLQTAMETMNWMEVAVKPDHVMWITDINGNKTPAGVIECSMVASQAVNRRGACVSGMTWRWPGYEFLRLGAVCTQLWIGFSRRVFPYLLRKCESAV